MPSPPGTAGVAPLSRPAPRVVLADDDVLLREGLSSLLERSGFEVVGQAGNSPELLALARSARPELAIIDIRMPPGQATEGPAGGAGDPRGIARHGHHRAVRACRANKATEAALAAYPGGIVDRVGKLSNGDYEVHTIGVNWPHHVFVNQDFKVIGAE